MMSRLFPKKYKTFIILAIFGIAMGFLEAIVVVYLREIYYPQGFEFPLNTFSPEMLSIEWIREISTIIMLITIGIIAGKNFLQKLSFFLYTFAIWDIFYYVALKLFLNWPPSLLTWDILFLIPVPWVGPVLAPIICSLTMILLGGSIVFLQEKGYIVKIQLFDWVLLFFGIFIIFCTFIWDYFRIIVQEDLLSSFWTLANNKHLQEIISQYKPTYYNWWLFAVGEILILFTLILIFRRSKSIIYNKVAKE